MPEIIPISANVHFKAAFNISSSKVTKIMTHLRQKFRAWCITKVGVNDPLLHRGWFYIGNNSKVEPAQYVINDFQVRTVSAPGVDPDEPSCWAFEMVHPDFDERARRWSVEITLRKSDDGSIRFTTVVKNWMIANYIGEYPPPPNASAPAYIRALLEDLNLQCFKGDTRLRSQPVTVNSKTCQSVYDQLASADRQAPFVVFGYSSGTGTVPLSPIRVATALIGNANVYVLSSQSVNDEMNYYLGEVLSCDYGSLRVYLTNFNKADPNNARFHRYLSSSFVAQHGEDGIIRFLTNGLSRNGSTFWRNDFTTFGDIYSERRRYTIKKLASESEEKSAETSLVWEENEAVRKDAANWEATALQSDTENSELKSQLSSMTYRVEEAERVRRTIRQLEAQVAGLPKLSSLPATLSGVLTTINSLFPERMVITSEALSAAEGYLKEQPDHWAKVESINVAWEMVFAICTTLYDLVFVQESKRLEAQFGEKFSHYELSMTEGKMTKKDAKLMALRKRTHDGKEYDISAHVKYGNRKPKLLRLYFAICRESKRFIVGHFGDHLDNYTTQKM